MKKLLLTDKDFDLIVVALFYHDNILQHKIEGETDSEKPDKKKINTYNQEQKKVASFRNQLIIRNERGDYNHEK